MYNLRGKIYDVKAAMYDMRFSVCKFFLFILLVIAQSTIKAQNTGIDSADILKRIAFQDSIFNHSNSKPLPKTKTKPTVPANRYVVLDSTANLSDSQKIIKDFLTNNKDSVFTHSSFNEKTGNGKIKKQKKIDTTRYSPKTAAWRAAVFPGLGQIYMKKYWKLPIVYVAMGAVLYFVIDNGMKLRQFNGYIRNTYDSIPNPAPYDDLDAEGLASYRNTYRKNVQLATFGTVFVWGLSILDAVVDAHLHSFDIGDKLTLRVKPKINRSYDSYYAGIALNLNFK